jgi:imidazolonepropionase-like amidohydrolase
VADLYALLREDSDFLKGASVADKVVGKAAAALMILGEVGELHADVVSRPALDLFADSGVRVSYGTAVPHIINRTKTGWCPLETCCRYCLTPQDCLVRIEEFITLQSKRMNSDK